MSVSKLESLPNEILIDILEKYINGMDILIAFAFQLNRRFDSLITQCQRLRFDFMRCHKDHFRFCIGLLPVYSDTIEELALSEQNTPGQVHAFLSFFPSFALFKRLRKLYFHVNAEAAEPRNVAGALHSLSETALNTLSIKITKVQEIYSFNDAIADIFRMKTLKKFSIICDSHRMNWELLNHISSNIEYLTIDGMFCKFDDLKYIFRCAPGLKYLNIQLLTVKYSNNYQSKLPSKNTITQMSMLHTVIFNIEGGDETTHTMLEPYLRSMPCLHSLEIRTHSGLHDFSFWETLLKTSVPTLTSFNLENSVFHLKDDDVSDILECMQTPFWTEKTNFNIIIKELARLNMDRFHLTGLERYNQYASNKPVARCWIGPRRKLNGNPLVMNKISSLNISTKSGSLLQDYYFDNVNHLVVHDLNDNLLELITTHVNCSSIRYVDVSFLKQENNIISSLLPYMNNITSIRIKLNQLSNDQFVYLRECNNLKFLDIPTVQHGFNEKDISIIGSMFPSIEHLTINTKGLRNIPLLHTYLPRLRSLTFANNEMDDNLLHDDYEQKILDESVRRMSQFLFQREANWVTVWIDQAAFQESYWQRMDTSSKRSIDNSMHTGLVDRLTSAYDFNFD